MSHATGEVRQRKTSRGFLVVVECCDRDTLFKYHHDEDSLPSLPATAVTHSHRSYALCDDTVFTLKRIATDRGDYSNWVVYLDLIKRIGDGLSLKWILIEFSKSAL